MRISKLYPLTINIDLPIPPSTMEKTNSDSEFIKDTIQNAAVATIIILVSSLAYRRIKMPKQKFSKQ